MIERQIRPMHYSVERVKQQKMVQAGSVILQRIQEGESMPDLLRESCAIAQTDQSLLTTSDRLLLSCYSHAEQQMAKLFAEEGKGIELIPGVFDIEVTPEIQSRIWDKTQDLVGEYTLKILVLSAEDSWSN